MNRSSGVLIAILSVLCVGLSINTVVQARSRTPAPATEELLKADPACDPGTEDGAMPLEEVGFEDIEVPPDAARLGFVGEWLNEEADLSSLSRITIAKEDDQFTIQPWSASLDGERPYGPAREFDCSENPAEITWDVGFAQQRTRLAVMPDGLLRVDRVAECVNHQCGIPRPPTAEYFFKATAEDLAAHEEAIAEGSLPDGACLPETPGGG